MESKSGVRRASEDEVRESVPEALRAFVERSFQSAFTRFVPAVEARVFSSRGEIASEKADAAGEVPYAESDSVGDALED